MSEFAATLRTRMRHIRESLFRAWDTDDDDEAAAAYGDLQDMARIADDHGIDVTDSDQPRADGRGTSERAGSRESEGRA